MTTKNFKVKNGINIGDSVTITDAGAVTGVTTITGATTVDTTNIEATNIKALDGTAAMTIADSTGIVTVSTQLQVDNINISTNTIASTDTNGNITLDPDGSGSVVLTLANGGNLTNDRNYVFGAVRNSTTAAAGDAWSFSSGAGTGFRGISIDSSAATTKAPATVIRGFTGGAVAAPTTTPTVLFERARGTSAAPTAIQSGDILGRILATGANGANTFIGDSVAASPATLAILSAENFASNTNVGTQFTLSLMPTAKTLASVATPTTVYTTTPQSTTSRSDSFTWQTGNTTAVPGSTTTLALDVNGNLAVTGDLTVTGNDIKSSGGTTAITLSGANVTGAGNISTTVGSINASGAFDVNQTLSATANLLDTNTTAGSSVGISTNYWTSSAKTTLSVPQSGNKLGNLRFNSYSDTAGTFALGSQVSVDASENWTGSANGSRIQFFANKQGESWTTGHVQVANFQPESSSFSSDIFTIENSAGTDYAVFNSTSALFSKTIRNTITSATVAKGGTFTPAATAMNSIILEITAGSGTTTIDVSNLTVASENAVFDIMVYNNSGGTINSNALVILNSGNTALDHGASIANGARAMFEVNCVDIYANAKYAGDAV